MEKHLRWYKDEFTALLTTKENNTNELDRIGANINNLKSDQAYKHEQIKA